MVRVTLKRGEIRKLLQSPMMTAMLRNESRAIASRAGQGYGSSTTVGKSRAHGYVFPMTLDARRDAAKNHTLERATWR